MRHIEINLNDFAKEHNQEYNRILSSISDEIFQTEKLDISGYVKVGEYREEEISKYAVPEAIGSDEYRNFSTSNDKFNLESEIDNSILSEYEKNIIRLMMYGSYNTYILCGPLGSGKSSTTNYVIDFIKTFICKSQGLFLNINFDFNQGWGEGLVNENDTETQKIIDKFKKDLFEKSKVIVSGYLVENVSKIDSFLLYINSDIDKKIKFSAFYDFWYDSLDENFANLSPLAKANRFLNYIKNTASIDISIDLLMYFFAFLKDDLSEREYILLCYDNLDKLPILAQKKLFEYINSLNQISKVKCIIPLRRATFSRVNSYLHTNSDIGALSYGNRHHHGPKVSDVVKKRLEFWIDNIDISELTKNLNKNYKNALKKRLEHLFNDANNSKPYGIISYLETLSGNSLRLGLSLCNKLVINNIIPYDSNENVPNSLFHKSLLVNSKDNLMGLDNSENGLKICHLFSLNQNFSLLPYKILAVIATFQKKSIQKQIASIFDLFKSFNIWSDEEIENALNFLLYVKRPLIWSDQSNGFANLNELQKSKANLFLTEIGDNYYTKLIYDLSYIQDALFSVKWSGVYVPSYIDIRKDSERFDTILKCLKEMYYNDIENSKLSNEWRELMGDRYLISIDIIEKITDSVRRIIDSYLIKNNWHIEILSNYKDFLLDLFNQNQSRKDIKEAYYKINDTIGNLSKRI